MRTNDSERRRGGRITASIVLALIVSAIMMSLSQGKQPHERYESMIQHGDETYIARLIYAEQGDDTYTRTLYMEPAVSCRCMWQWIAVSKSIADQNWSYDKKWDNGRFKKFGVLDSHALPLNQVDESATALVDYAMLQVENEAHAR